MTSPDIDTVIDAPDTSHQSVDVWEQHNQMADKRPCLLVHHTVASAFSKPFQISLAVASSPAVHYLHVVQRNINGLGKGNTYDTSSTLLV